MNALTINSGIDPFIIIEQASIAESTKMQYTKALKNYLATGNNLGDAKALADYAQGLKQSSKAFLKAAIRLWSRQVEIATKGQANPDNVNAVQASVYRLEALNEAISVKQVKGDKAHIWLTQAEVKKLFSYCGDSLQGQRDRLTIGLLVGAGLRREELSNLCFTDVMMQGDRTVIEVRGKGSKFRTIPIRKELAKAIEQWSMAIDDNSGYIIRSMNNGTIGDSISSVGIFNIVNRYGEKINKPELAPHDLRRTYAQLGFEAGIPITQISKLLGHSNVATTQRYLNLDLDLETTISDFIPFE